MKRQGNEYGIITRLFFRLLPLQILIASISYVNGIVSGLFTSNFIGENAMSAIGLYLPFNQLTIAICLMLVGGSQILCGKYMGKYQVERTQEIFSLSLMMATSIVFVVIVALLAINLFGFTRFLTADIQVQELFKQYVFGQVIGLFPLVLGQVLAAFLSLENQVKRATIASITFILTSAILDYIFIVILQLKMFGLALASSLGLWVYFLIQLSYFLSKKSTLRFGFTKFNITLVKAIFSTGFPGALSQCYQAIRRILVNMIILRMVGLSGLSAFATIDSLLGIFWAIPDGMLAVSRMLFSISIGEEDRKTLVSIIRNMFYHCVPIMLGIVIVIALSSGFLAHWYYQDVTSQVYLYTRLGLRVLPFCMPLSIIYMHFVCYGQALNKTTYVHILSLLDGVLCVAGYSYLLVPYLGLNGVFVANILNGITTSLFIYGYAWYKNHAMPKTIADLMVFPNSFGVSAENRMDYTVSSIADVMVLSKEAVDFCQKHGVDKRRSYYAGLFLEEMATNIIQHGFTKDKKKHEVDVRVVYKDNAITMRLKDDCVPFNPEERSRMIDSKDLSKNMGIRMVYELADSVQYQNILGLNVLLVSF